MALIVMDYLQPHIIMRKGLIRGTEYPRFAQDIAEFLAQTLFATSALGAPAAEHKRRVAAFAPDVALCRITEDLVFTDPYRDAKLNRWTRPFLDDMAEAFRRDGPLKRAAQERKYQFVTRAEALIHGDLHTGSIMVTPASTKVIDPEFAFVGPMGFDVGAVLGNLLLAFFAQSGHEAAPGARDRYRAWVLDTIAEVWRCFEARFLDLWRMGGGEVLSPSLFDAPEDRAVLALSQARFMRGLFEDAAAFAGCKMIRRILGLAHVEDLESIADPARRAVSERRAPVLARELAPGAGTLLRHRRHHAGRPDDRGRDRVTGGESCPRQRVGTQTSIVPGDGLGRKLPKSLTAHPGPGPRSAPASSRARASSSGWKKRITGADGVSATTRVCTRAASGAAAAARRLAAASPASDPSR